MTTGASSCLVPEIEFKHSEWFLWKHADYSVALKGNLTLLYFLCGGFQQSWATFNHMKPHRGSCGCCHWCNVALQSTELVLKVTPLGYVTHNSNISATERRKRAADATWTGNTGSVSGVNIQRCAKRNKYSPTGSQILVLKTSILYFMIRTLSLIWEDLWNEKWPINMLQKLLFYYISMKLKRKLIKSLTAAVSINTVA